MTEPTTGATPTVVLVHGAFADSSSWNDVVSGLLDAGIRVMAVSNPLRGVSHDSEYVASVLSQVAGPVLAVGHSYGGAVISNAAVRAGNVVGLVYVAAFAPDEGERLQDIESDSKDSVLSAALTELKYPDAGGTAVEFAIDPEQFHAAFAADLPPHRARVLSLTQRPVAALAFSEPSGPPSWRTLPSWAVVPTGDRAAGSDVLLRMAQRAGARITEVDGSHVIMTSQPQTVVQVIQEALTSLTRT